MLHKKRFGKRFISLVLALLLIVSVTVTGVSTVSAASNTKNIYFSSNGFWDKFFAVYAWDDVFDNGFWYPLIAVEGEEDLYCAEINESHQNIIFCSRSTLAYKWDCVVNKTDALVIPENSNYLTLAGINTAMWGRYVEAGNELVYFVPSEEWMNIQSVSGHSFVLHAYNAEDQAGVWIPMELVSGGFGEYPSIFVAEVNSSYSEFDFCRVEVIDNDGTFTLWESTYSQTKPVDSNMFTQDAEGKTGTWSYTGYIEPEIPEETEPTVPEETTPEVTEPTQEPEHTKTIYFTSNDTWKETVSSSIGKVSAYAWNSASSESGTWYWLNSSNLEGAEYEVVIDAEFDSIKFGISYSDTPDGVWSETEELVIPTDSNHFTQDADDETIGTWSSISEKSENYYYVAFVNGDGTYISAQVVKEGESATAPENPTIDADAQYTYKFVGWDKDFSNITEDTIVTALYTKTVNKYTVTFKDYDDKIIDTQSVEYGKSATAPQEPVREGYTFSKWDKAFDNVTTDLTVTAVYTKNSTSTEVVTTGKLQVEVSGGSGFTVSVNGGNARPQGLSYLNTQMPIAATVTVVASSTNGNEFIGWMNATTGAIVSTSETYTFATSGNDFIKAMYSTEVAGVNLVTFKNNRAAGGLGQILDMQYYAAGDEIVFPADPTLTGYDFAGWNMTAEEIAAELAAGRDVVVLPTWTAKIVYVKVSVNGGQITNGLTDGNGGYLYNRSVTVVADVAESGKKFAYWADQNGNVRSYQSTYTFNAYFDVELTAVYVEEAAEIDYEVIVGISADPTADTIKIGYSLFWEVPEELGTFVQGGILIVEQKNYNEANFVVGGNAQDTNITQAAPGAAQSNPQPGYTVNKTNSFIGTSWYAKAFVQYRDANGDIQTAYSDMVAVDKI